MDKQINVDNKNIFLLLILSVFLLVGSEVDNNIIKAINFVFGGLSWSLIYKETRRAHNHELAIVKLFILSLPLSFIDMFGNTYGTTLLSWFNIFFLIIVLTYILKYLIKGMVSFDHLALLSLVLIIISLIPVLRGRNILSGISQYINLIVSFILIIIGSSFKYSINDKELNILRRDYIFTTIITAIGLFVQIFSVHVLNMRIGKYNFFGGYRHAFGFLFTDYSFLSLYLVSGAIMLYFFKKKDKYFGKRWIGYFILILLASIFTSARTGIAAFIVAFVVFNLRNIINFIKKDSRKSIIIISAIILLIFSSLFLFSKIRNTAIFSDSGRFALNQRAFEMFLASPISGLGFGDSNYPGMLPHNLLFQYLAQGGIIFAIPLFLYLLIILGEAEKRDKSLIATLACILLGALFIPNIFDSRFLPALLFILSLTRLASDYSPITLKELLLALKKRLWLIITLSIVSISVSGLASYYLLDNQYATFSTIRIIDAKYSNYNQYSKLIRSDEVADQVIKNLDLNMTNRQFRSRVNGSRIGTSEMMEIEVINKSPDLAADISNEIARVSRKEALKDKMWTMIVTEAEEPRTPIRPMPMVNMAIGGIFGLAVGIFIVFYKEFFKGKAK